MKRDAWRNQVKPRARSDLETQRRSADAVLPLRVLLESFVEPFVTLGVSVGSLVSIHVSSGTQVAVATQGLR